MEKILTRREKDVFDLLTKNYTTSEIADELNITKKTVRNHISNVIQKMGVCSRTQAILELIKLNEINF